MHCMGVCVHCICVDKSSCHHVYIHLYSNQYKTCSLCSLERYWKSVLWWNVSWRFELGLLMSDAGAVSLNPLPVCVCVYVFMPVCNCHLSPACRKSIKDFNWTLPVDAKCISPESQNPFYVPCVLFKGTLFQNGRPGKFDFQFDRN